jgi:signal transduction histidine kinase
MRRLLPVRFYGAVRVWQALLEAVAGSLVYFLLLLRLTPAISSTALMSGVALFGPCCALWCALRIRFIDGSRLRKVAREIAIPMLLGIGMGLGVALPLFTVGHRAFSAWTSAQNNAIVFSLLAILSVGPLYAVLRIGVWILRLWRRFQRRSMALSLTNSILSIVLVVWIGFQIVSILLIALTRPSLPFPQDFAALGAWLYTQFSLSASLFFGTSLMLICLLGGLLPLAAVFSFWVARRTTRRLVELARTTGRMRRGEYDARVPVQGEDELARLQTDFNSMAEALERTLRDLQTERDRVQGVLLSRRELVVGISHDLRTPVATIRALLEAGRKPGSTVPDSSNLETMEREIIRLQGLIDELFKVSQAEVDQLTLDLRPTQVRELIQQRVAAVAPLAWQSGRVQVSADAPESLPAAMADRTRLEQAVSNLLHNAVRHTPPGGVVIVRADSGPAGVRIVVQDTGVGVDSEDLPRIWERYYRGHHAQEDAGAGIGLALVREYTEAMGGTVSVESIRGQGSSFSICLPRAETGRAPV